MQYQKDSWQIFLSYELYFIVNEKNGKSDVMDITT